MGVLLARLEYHRSEVRMIYGIGPLLGFNGNGRTEAKRIAVGTVLMAVMTRKEQQRRYYKNRSLLIKI